jgi:hypothetical protein
MKTVPRFLLVGALAVTLCVAGASRAGAQTRSSITGTIVDTGGGVLPGVTLTLASPNMVGGVRQAVTNAQGVYRFSELPPGVFELTATLQGFQTLRRTELRVAVATTLTIDLVMPVGAVTETVTVSGQGPIVDIQTTASTTKLATETLESLPVAAVSNRGYEAFQLAPGVNVGSSFGSAADANNLTVDGGGVTIPQRQGTAAAVVNLNWMEEVQVLGLGANAEYGEFSGVSANMVMRSGSNRFSGLADYRMGHHGWSADNRGGLSDAQRASFAPQRILESWDASLQAGGPIKQDRLFYFAGVQYERSKLVRAGVIGNVPSESRWPRVATKLTWAPHKQLRSEGFVEYDRNDFSGNLPLNSQPECASEGRQPKTSWNVRLTWTINGSTLADARYSGLRFFLGGLPEGRRAGPPPRRDRITGISSGNPAQWRDQWGERDMVTFSVTRHVDGFLGRSHELKAGFEFEHTKYREQGGYPGGRSYTDASGVPEQFIAWAGDTIQGIGERSTIYVQDGWSVTGRLSIQAGVRLSFNRGSVSDKGTVFETNPVSPRIGAAWDFLGDRRTVLRVHYGRYHEGLYTSVFDFMNTAGQTPRITYRILGSGDFQEINRVTPAGNVAVDSEVTQAFQNQFVVGLEREVLAGLSVKLQYIRRNFDAIWAFVDTRSVYQEALRQDPGPDARLGTADDGQTLTVFNLVNPGQSFLVLTNPPDAYRKYDALQVVAQKRLSRNWQLMAGYTWSKSRGTVNNGQSENSAAGSDTGRTGIFVNPNARINSSGPNMYDCPHTVHMNGTYTLPFWRGLSVSGTYRYSSGGAWGRTAVVTGLQQGTQTIRIETRGTRRTPALSQANVRFEQTFRPRASRLVLAVQADVFNVTNQGIDSKLRANEASGATLGAPTLWSDPRTLRLGVRVSF